MGWLRDYLWLYSAQLINGYTPYGMITWRSGPGCSWTLGVGNRLHVPDLLERLLAELIETLVWARAHPID